MRESRNGKTRITERKFDVYKNVAKKNDWSMVVNSLKSNNRSTEGS